MNWFVLHSVFFSNELQELETLSPTGMVARKAKMHESLNRIITAQE